MPVDMAVQLYITHSPPSHSFLSSYEGYRMRNLIASCCKPLRPCISTGDPHHTPPCPAPPCPALPCPAPPCPARPTPQTKSQIKKKVVFADSRGMSLTAVRVFTPCESDNNSHSLQHFHVPKIEGALNPVQSRTLKFRQPSADYLDFRNRLTKNWVCLESCTLQRHTLTGTVKVRNLSFQKRVHVRITFDSWQHQQDVECAYMNDVCGGRDTDTFFFIVEIPECVSPQDSVEFCISYTAAGTTNWDNNHGKNYALEPTPEEKNEKTPETHLFDRLRPQQKCSRFSAELKDWIGISAPYW